MSKIRLLCRTARATPNVARVLLTLVSLVCRVPLFFFSLAQRPQPAPEQSEPVPSLLKVELSDEKKALLAKSTPEIDPVDFFSREFRPGWYHLTTAAAGAAAAARFPCIFCGGAE